LGLVVCSAGLRGRCRRRHHLHVHARLHLLERPNRLYQFQIRLAGNAPASIRRFDERAVRGGEMGLPRQTEIQLAFEPGQFQPPFGVRVERLSEFVHTPENCTTTADTLSLHVPLSACFMSALHAPSGSLPVR
jgi:hypothetical protein